MRATGVSDETDAGGQGEAPKAPAGSESWGPAEFRAYMARLLLPHAQAAADAMGRMIVNPGRNSQAQLQAALAVCKVVTEGLLPTEQKRDESKPVTADELAEARERLRLVHQAARHSG